MKKIKKLIVAVMAMAMALGMLTMTASAADDTVKVTVIWEGADGDATSLYGWEGVELGGWPGTEMTNVDASTYTLDITPTGDTCMLIANNSLGQTADLGPVDTTKGDITLTIGAEEDGKYTAEITYADAGSTEVGDATPIVAIAVLAVVSLAGVVVSVKRRTVAE